MNSQFSIPPPQLRVIRTAGQDVVGFPAVVNEVVVVLDTNRPMGALPDHTSSFCQEVRWTMGEEKDSDSVGVAMRLPQGTSQNGVLPSEEKIQLKIETEEVLVQSLTNGNAARRENGEKGSMEDDELTSLSWLQDNNLLKNIRMGTYGDEAEDLLSDSPTSDFLEDPLDLSGDHVGREFSRGAPSGYNPKLHIYAKPPYSFSCLIFMAIENSPNKALPVKDIYSWILTHFPYFHNAPTGWKNSVRHNLSLNKCFRKVNKDVGQNIGKGSLWSIDPEFRPNLLHAVRRAPYHPYNQLNNFHRLSVQSVSAQNIGTDKPTPLTPAQSNVNVPSPELFPYLSRRLAASGSKGDPEVDAAATMLELKNGPQLQAGSENGNENKSGCHRKKLKRNHPARISTSDPDEEVDRAVRSGKLAPVITSSPSEDHTYSASPSRPGVNFSSSVGTNSPGSSIDEPFEFSDGSSRKSDNSNGFSSQETEEDDEDCSQEAEHTAKQREEEERKKLTEGAQALLNLAKGATIKKRQYSQKCSSSDTSRHQQDDR